MSTVHAVTSVTVGTPIDQRVFRETLGHYASGITVISGTVGEEPFGFTCQSFYSVSVEPPLVSFSVMVTSTTYPKIRESGRFAVNVLSDSQQHISDQFARKGTDKWAGVEWSSSRRNNPIIAGTQMWVDCDIESEYMAGDHYIVVGRVNEVSDQEWHSKTPLVFFRGKYRELKDLSGA